MDSPESDSRRLMSEKEVRRIAKEAARETVQELAQTAGVDPEQIPQDLRWIRQWRQANADAKQWAARTAVTVLVGGFLGFIWMSIKSFFGK